MNSDAFPGADWRRSETSEHALSGARAWLDSHGSEARYRVVVIQSGKLVAEWNQNADSDDHLGLASAAKSVFSCMLAVAVDEGRVDSPDAKVVDYYPEMMDVPEGAGPKPGRYAFEKDPEITFRQLISNTSGYMKPNENPGTVYHYQTYGMNILTHAIAKVYGHYDPADVDGSPGLQPLVDEKLRDPIGASWSYYRMNFDLHAAARTDAPPAQRHVPMVPPAQRRAPMHPSAQRRAPMHPPLSGAVHPQTCQVLCTDTQGGVTPKKT